MVGCQIQWIKHVKNGWEIQVNSETMKTDCSYSWGLLIDF